MSYTLSFNQIYDSDVSKVGFRAVDLAKIYKGKQQTPLSFVVPDLIFEEFLLHNRLSLEIQKILGLKDTSSINSAYLEIKSLFRKAAIPDEYIDSLREAYMTLGVESGDPEDLLKDKSPVVNLIVSPSYDLDAESLEGVFLNIHGFDNFIDAIKSVWLFLYSPSQIELRTKKGIKDFSTGVIVERFIDSESCVEGTSKSFIGNFDITLEAYKGLPDILRESSKDSYTLSKEYLTIEHHESLLQEYKLLKSETSGLVLKRNLGKTGFGNKIEDSLIIETARIIKKMSSLLDNYFRAFFVIRKGEINCFLINRLQGEASGEKRAYKEKQEQGEFAHNSASESESSSLKNLDAVVSSDNDVNKSGFSSPDSTFFLSIILDLEPQIDSELFKKYKESFGFYPTTFFEAAEKLDEKHGFPEKEQIYKLKNIKSIVESGGSINLEEFMTLIDSLKTFIAGQNGHT